MKNIGSGPHCVQDESVKLFMLEKIAASGQKRLFSKEIESYSKSLTIGYKQDGRSFGSK